MSLSEFDVLIVTALQLERRAVRAHLVNVVVERDSGMHADIGVLPQPDGDLTVAVIETGPGNVAAAILAGRSEEIFRPAVVLMVGIAGGLKDVSIGDVVASTKIYWYESGKQQANFGARPDFAPVGNELLQSARAVASHDSWRDGVIDPQWPPEMPPAALAAPTVVGEKVLANTTAPVVMDIRAAFGDAVCVNMEDYGALRGAGFMQRAQTLAVRGISDLIDAKGTAEEKGSQPQAAAHAAAFAIGVIDRYFAPGKPSGSRRSPTRVTTSGTAIPTQNGPRLVKVGRLLYPEGPQQDSLWERAGGDLSRLPTGGNGQARWWQAVRLVERGGGPTLAALLQEMLADYPANVELQAVRDAP